MASSDPVRAAWISEESGGCCSQAEAMSIKAPSPSMKRSMTASGNSIHRELCVVKLPSLRSPGLQSHSWYKIDWFVRNARLSAW